jgi:hypothetical protein
VPLVVEHRSHSVGDRPVRTGLDYGKDRCQSSVKHRGRRALQKALAVQYCAQFVGAETGSGTRGKQDSRDVLIGHAGVPTFL